MITSGGILADIRARDGSNIGVVSLLANSPLLVQLLAVWRTVARRVKPGSPFEQCPDDLPPEDRVRWMWSAVEPEPDALWAEIAGLPDAPHVRRAIRCLQDNAIVFPDGTLSRWAEKFLVESAKRSGVREDEPSAGATA